MLRAKHMGFKSVRRVEVKAETTTPGELRATTDASGARVSASRGRRTLPKLEFTVDEDGAVLHGPQRGSYPFFGTSSTNSNAVTQTDAPFHTALERDLAASFQALHMRDFPAPREEEATELVIEQPNNQESTGAIPTPMKDCVLNDTRATTLALKFDNSVGKFVCGSSIERFSGHTGVCKVLGSKKYPVSGHSLCLGDLLRIGSVGLVVCEINRTTSEETEEALTKVQYEFIKDNYLSLPLQQTFHPTERSPDFENSGERDKDDEQILRVGGDTSDEGESEEDKDRKARTKTSGDGDESATMQHNNLPLGVAGTTAKRFCYICYDGDEDADNNPLVAPCHCKGDTKYVHLDCLQRWNNNLDADGENPNQRVCAVTNTDGLDVCSICKATYLTSVRLDDGRLVSLLAKKLAPPYVTFAVVTQHETRNRSTALTNTRFQLSFANMPRNQQFLTIGRSTTNNMTLRYRTVSQLHAKVKYQDNHFILYDAASSNGTMLFLSKPLELEWGKAMHVKIGRTILTLKAKKKWKWAGTSGDEEEEESGCVSSPRAGASNGTGGGFEHRLSGSVLAPRGNGFDMIRSINDPSAELVATPTPPNTLASRPMRQRSLSSTGSMLRGDGSADALLVPSAFQDELMASTFATQNFRESAVVSFRDFAAENASLSLTSRIVSDETVSTQTRPELLVSHGLYDQIAMNSTERAMHQD
ncbi:fha domain protein [Plasmopara halstedii]|uniref:Fha domain protein n=1 Tax=Plasmopara halstedii TaxID=4781 RepID=A0A0P1B4K2_PLAHL|nr:fha domain protein [Plasmopara halstedii]CEG49303.1 fha domain protein [Plasmopara halstedii]|eukprot:XP_024585672.1 fha domain protein [Plasmopara halstedii]